MTQIKLTTGFATQDDAKLWVRSQSGFYARKGIDLVIRAGEKTKFYYVWRTTTERDSAPKTMFWNGADKHIWLSVLEYIRLTVPNDIREVA